MPNKLLNNVSYGLVRTNPKLSCNVKLLSNDNDLFLESFNANTQLSDKKFKSFKISGDSTYNNDIYKFFDFGRFPKELAYSVFQKNNDTSVLSSYDNQYDMFYSAGTEALKSKSYTEELSMLAPIWLKKEIPNYFVIFRLDNPNSINKTNRYNSNIITENSTDFNKNILEKCTLIKTFDLTRKSKLGNYLRNYYEQKDFPKAPINTTWDRNEPILWNGISYKSGGFTSNSKYSYEDLISKDSTIINNEFFFTKGFQNTGVIVANLINLQFLFTDDVDDFSMNRYFGFYVNDINEGNFNFSEYDFYKNKNLQQEPLIKTTKLDESLELKNDDGVLLYTNNIDSVTGEFTSSRLNELESIFYIKDKNNNFYNIKKGSTWNSNEIRLANKKIKVKPFISFEESKASAQAKILKGKRRSVFSIKINGNIPDGLKITLYNDNEQLGIISANSNIATQIGKAKNTFFNTQGNNKENAISLSQSINMGISENNKFFTSYYHNDTVYIVSKISGSRSNQLKVEINLDEYPETKIETYPAVNPDNIINNFIGGTSKPDSSLILEKGDEIKFTGKFIKTASGYTQIINYLPYLEEPIINNDNIIGFRNIDKYIIANTENNGILLSSIGKISVYEKFKPSFGRFSFFPLKDFDFDFFDESYSKKGELVAEEKYYQDIQNPDIKEFYEDSTFGNLISILKEADPDKSTDSLIKNEYERLQENYLKSQAVSSRIIPYINKWSYYKEGKDVRNNPYRLNLSEAFTINNFAPSQYEFKRSTFNFSHEWYYLSTVPEYFTEDDIKKSWSYFSYKPIDSKFINDEYIPGTFQTIENNLFDFFFITDSLINSNNEKILIDKQIKYSEFSGGSSISFAETFLRGVKVTVKPKKNISDNINFNTKNISYTKNSKFNNYKFSVLLVPNLENKPNREIKIINNEKWKTIVILLSVNLGDVDKLDRTSLYSLINSYKDGDFTKFDNKKIQGAINFKNIKQWSQDASKKIVRGQLDINRIRTKFLTDIKIGSSGQFNDIIINIKDNNDNIIETYAIIGISKVLSDTEFICNKVLKNVIIDPSDNTITSGTEMSILDLELNSPTTLQMKRADYIILGGGFNQFKELLDSLSFAAIAKDVNQGNPEIVYETVDKNGNPILDKDDNFAQTFVLNLKAQDDIIKSVYLGISPDPNKPTKFNLIDIVGYDLTILKTPRVTPITRHSGFYEPLTKDLLFFEDPYIDEVNTENIKLLEFTERGVNSRLTPIISNKIDSYKLNVFELMRHKNTQFNSKLSNKFGQIKNLFYHKVNPENQSSVLELSDTSGFISLYPLINEVGIEKKDFYIFKSNWENNYFTKHIDKKETKKIKGINSTKEKKSFLASKYIKTPETVIIEKFNGVEFSEEDLAEEGLTGNNVLYEEDGVNINLYILLKNAIIDKLFIDIKKSFNKYIDPGFEKMGDDEFNNIVIDYISKNILDEYQVKNINFFSRAYRTNEGTDYTTLQLSDQEKFNIGLNLNTNITTKSLNFNDFDLKLIYNKRTGFSEKIGLSIKLNKK